MYLLSDAQREGWAGWSSLDDGWAKHDISVISGTVYGVSDMRPVITRLL